MYTIATKGDKLYPIGTTRQIEDFMLFNNYTDIFGEGYDALYDYQSPAYFYPSNCGVRFGKNDVRSTQIAFVGTNSSVSLKV